MFGHQNNNDQGTTDHAAPTADVTPGAPETIAPTTTPVNDNHGADYAVTDLPSVKPVAPAAPTVVNAPAGAHDVAAPKAPAVHAAQPAGDLLELKHAALQELSPLVGHLEQSPEEKFRTTMMMIQASDDQSMLHAAFDAAKHIADDKTRAQALLDVVNEINYFTQQQGA